MPPSEYRRPQLQANVSRYGLGGRVSLIRVGRTLPTTGIKDELFLFSKPGDANHGNLYWWDDDAKAWTLIGTPNASANHNLLSTTHPDSLAASVVRGDIMVGSITPKWARKSLGAAGKYLRSDGFDLVYATILTSDVPDGADGTAIHDNIAAEISAITEKATPVDADWVLIEDSEDSGSKKRAQLGNLPGGGGGTSHALFGAYFPGVLSTGIKTTPQYEYRGDPWTCTKLSCRVAVPSGTNPVVVQFRMNGSDIGTAVSITAGNNAAEVTGLDIDVVDKDYFDIEITGIGATPNEGSDLHWQGLP